MILTAMKTIDFMLVHLKQRNLYFLLIVTLLSSSSCQSSEIPLPTRAYLPTTNSTVTQDTANVDVAYPTATLLPTTTDTPTVTITPTATLIPIKTYSPTGTITATSTSTQTALNTPIPEPVKIDYDSVYSPSQELRRALNRAFRQSGQQLPEARYTVSAVRTMNTWAKITLVPTAFVDANWEDIHLLRYVEVYAFEVEPFTWDGSVSDATTLQTVPPEFVNHTLPPLSDSHRFPWERDAVWWATQGWHEGYALDFQPSYGEGSAVLATQSGILREICYDGFQSLLQIEHGDGIQTYYMHVRVAGTVRRTLLDQPIRQGQLLGYLYSGERGQTPCGSAWTPHLHFISSDPNLVIDGIALGDIADVASCCQAPPTFTSTNEIKRVGDK